MNFGDLRIDNFMRIVMGSLNLTDRGLCLIQGVNEDDSSADSNGAGKSTVADALCWCLFGTTARGLSGDDVVRIGSKGGTIVGTDLYNEDGSYYRITRYRKHKTGKNGLQVLLIDPTATTTADLTKGTDKLTQEVVNRALGCSYEVFKAAIYAGQEQLPDLPALTDKNLKMLVEEAAGTDVLERAYQLANQAKGFAETDVVRATAAVNSANLHLSYAQDAYKVESDRTVAYDEKIDADLKAIIAEKAEILQTIEDASAIVTSLDLPGNEHNLMICDAKIAAVKGEQDELLKLESSVRTFTTSVEIAINDEKRTRAEASRLKAALDGIDKIVGTNCGECDKPYCEHDVASAKKLAHDKLMLSLVELKKNIAALAAKRDALTKHTEARDAFKASMTDLSVVVSDRACTVARIDSIQNKVRDIKALESDVIRLDKIAAETRVNPHRAALAPLDDKCKVLLKKLNELGKDLIAKNLALTDAEIVSKVYAPAGVRAHILDTVTPFLNDRTAKYLSVLTDGNISATWSTLVKTAKGELREKFSIEVVQKSGGTSFAAISGGEKRKVRIATAMALQDMIASRATKPIGLFIADEIDDALDPAGLERLMMILEEKAASCGSLFIISHSNLKDWCSNVLTVTRKDGISTISSTAA